MPPFDDSVGNRSSLVPMPGLKQSVSPSGSLAEEDSVIRPLPAFSEQNQDPSTGQLSPFGPTTGQLTNASITRVLAATRPGVSETTSQRMPVVIKGEMKKAAAVTISHRSHTRRRLVVSLLGIFVLFVITGLALLSVTPMGHDIGLFNPQQPGSSMITNQNTGLNNLVVQATATAVFHRQTDGYSGGGAQLVGNGSGSLNWPVGQCTYWANSRYHALTGHWVPWSGNADQWVAGARSANWNVSTSPHVPSIIVLMPGVQGASSFGHVAIVESASGNTVHTSTMNWYANGGGWDIVSSFDFTTGPGVYFVWHP